MKYEKDGYKERERGEEEKKRERGKRGRGRGNDEKREGKMATVDKHMERKE